MKTALSLLTTLALSVVAAPAIDRYEALSQIESRNNDRLIGPQREVSRYQILPELWTQAWHHPDTVSPTDPAAAKTVVMRIMQTRCEIFSSRYGHAPNDFEFYLLWHRPACYIGRPVPRPVTAAEAGRARRFANLCEIKDTTPLASREKPATHGPLLAQSPRS